MAHTIRVGTAECPTRGLRLSAPSLKLASNPEMAARMADDIDYDRGPILGGAKTLGECGEDIFHLILETVSGSKSASEKSGFGELEFVPWQLGATL